MDLTLIICAHNEEGELGETIDIARAKTRGKLKEIVVVDNASTDRTAEVAVTHGARVVHENEKGLPAARQRGLEETQGDYIAYIDADTHLSDSWIDAAESILSKNPEAVSLSGPRRYFGAAPYRVWILNAMWAFAPIVYRVVGYMILGGNFIAKRSALEAMGGFDKSIKFYGEDTDIARRISKHGKTLFRMNFYAYASARRFEEEGLVKVNILYALNYLWPVLFGRPYTQQSKDVR